MIDPWSQKVCFACRWNASDFAADLPCFERAGFCRRLRSTPEVFDRLSSQIQSPWNRSDSSGLQRPEHGHGGAQKCEPEKWLKTKTKNSRIFTSKGRSINDISFKVFQTCLSLSNAWIAIFSPFISFRPGVVSFFFVVKKLLGIWFI